MAAVSATVSGPRGGSSVQNTSSRAGHGSTPRRKNDGMDAPLFVLNMMADRLTARVPEFKILMLGLDGAGKSTIVDFWMGHGKAGLDPAWLRGARFPPGMAARRRLRRGRGGEGSAAVRFAEERERMRDLAERTTIWAAWNSAVHREDEGSGFGQAVQALLSEAFSC